MIFVYAIGAFAVGLSMTVFYVRAEVENDKEIAVAPVVILTAAAIWPVVMLLGGWFVLAKLIVRATR